MQHYVLYPRLLFKLLPEFCELAETGFLYKRSQAGHMYILPVKEALNDEKGASGPEC